MARLQVEPNQDIDPTLPGGRNVVHRWTVVLDPDDMADLVAGNPVKFTVTMPDITVKHLFVTVSQGSKAN